MAVIETRQYTESQWLKYEEGQNTNKGITRTKGDITLTAGDVLVTGTVLTFDGTKWTAAATTDSVDGIFIRGYDDLGVKNYTIEAETTGDYKGVILNRGTAIVAKQALIQGTLTDAELASGLKALQINLDEQV